ncbi:Piwi-domain-containing protein [Lentinus tigrinus ALCF2SS1-6]|uniref:Piwi-domain-containing protein n=1 Tax=Lentinus tigrinus ALCF2SS1-6 TaxID=1328759 RepID=A0A5C2SRH8_9APHY|nr:Piwi-domain-containing protein [Lentinus tigrinus ALCF2SS1-6]
MNRRPLNVTTNSYEVTALPTRPYFHFDVITPPSVAKGRNYEIIDRLQTDNADVFNPRPVFDGRKNMFCRRDIPSRNYSVAMGRDRNKVTHTVTIKRVSIINPTDVQKLTRPRQQGDSAELNAMSLSLLQLIVRQAPNIRHRFPADARSFYVETNSRDLRIGLSAWRGFFQSVRPTQGRLLINIDVSHAAVYTPGPLIETMLHHLDLRDVRDLQTINPQNFARLRTFLKGVHVAIVIPGQSRDRRPPRPRPISNLIAQAGMQEFDKDGERLTVQRHFETKYNLQVRYPRIVGVRIGKTAIIPAEFCHVVGGQVYRKKIPPQAQKMFLEFATQKPRLRITDIRNAVANNTFNYRDSDFMTDSGMRVQERPIEINGELIEPPPIKYGPSRPGSNQPDILNVAFKSGSWNVVNRRFWKPEALRNWGVVVFDRVQEQTVQRFVTTLVTNLQKLGMTVMNPHPPIRQGNATNPEATLQELLAILRTQYERQFGRPQLFLVMLPANAADCRRIVKHWGDIKMTISTQCVRNGKWERCNDQYCNNVALKINSRLGGVNSAIHSPFNDVLKESMVIGADVGHPGPGINNRPSVTGMVATVDPDVNMMTSAASIQRPRLEIIQDLDKMVKAALGDWRAWRANNIPGYEQNQLPPKYIIFYRDGVSEGEFSQVAEQEIPLIKAAFAQSGLPERMWPKLLFIVVGKRHHIRFFPIDERDGDKSGNCPAGLLVDKQITNPNYQDFYLQSHAGLLGTSRPSHYVIILNETNLDKQAIQTLTFHLCHTYASATRSVSIPAPVYYADKICGRLEFHCENGASLSDTASDVTGGTAEFDLEEWKRMFKNTNLHRHKYFI